MNKYNNEIISEILQTIEETKQFASKSKYNILVSTLYNITKK